MSVPKFKRSIISSGNKCGFVKDPGNYDVDPGNYDQHKEYVGPTYGPDVVRDGVCPRTPEFGICDAHECAKDNHCENSAMKCCISSCWFMMCRDAVPGEK